LVCSLGGIQGLLGWNHHAGLTAGGDLLPCVPAPVKLGNDLEEDFEEIWVNSELLNYITAVMN